MDCQRISISGTRETLLKLADDIRLGCESGDRLVMVELDAHNNQGLTPCDLVFDNDDMEPEQNPDIAPGIIIVDVT